jgi:hypothetical protein
LSCAQLRAKRRRMVSQVNVMLVILKAIVENKGTGTAL